MATKIHMEALSPTMEEGRLVKWLKNEGDSVSNGDVLAEVETDKAIMELVARGEGVLRARSLPEGEAAPVGQVIGVIAGADEDISALVAEAGGAGGSGGAAADTGAGGPPESDATTEPEAGTTQSSAPATESAPQPETAPAGTDRQEKASGHAPRTSMPTAQEPASEQPPHARDTDGRVRSSPLARRLASEQGLELDQIRGTGPGGRIVRRDIETAIQSGTAPQAAAPAAAPAPAREGDFTDIPLTQIRKTIARRLSESIGPIPTFYLTVDFDLERAAEMRSAMAAMGDEYKVSFNDIIMKAVATALAQHPEVNAHWLGDRIREFNRVHLGMAVATDDGLIVPVIFDADRKGLRQLSTEARALAKRARERKLKPEEYTGSTFSVSNLGMFGIEQFTAIINPPESGILAIGAIEQKSVVVDGEAQLRRRLRLTMSCDHRVIDGAIGARFLQTLRRLIENPLMLVY